MGHRQRRKRALARSVPTQPLESALRKLARLAVASSLGAVSSCGDPFDDWTPVTCNQSSNLLGGASLAADVDYLGLFRDFNNIDVPRSGGGVHVLTLGSSGEPCVMASDASACRGLVMNASVARDACRNDQICGQFAVVNRGDQVELIAERSDFLKTLGRVDTLMDALAISAWDGKVIRCGGGDKGTRYISENGMYSFATEWEDCGRQVQRDSWDVTRDGATTETQVERISDSNCAVGRRPAGLLAVERRFEVGTLAAFFAQAAHLEAASVYAFERLARELTSLNADASLIARAAKSARDEIRHAHAVAQLARRFGGEAYPVRLVKARPRSLFEVAHENAIEGCIHETYGALIAHHQAALAGDPLVARVMRVIAVDEARHAQLAWHIAAWAEPQLSAAQREELQQAQRAALAALALSQRYLSLPPSAARIVGLPEPAVAQQLVRDLARLVVPAIEQVA